MKKRKTWKGLSSVVGILVIVSILISGCGAPTAILPSPAPVTTPPSSQSPTPAADLTEEYIKSLPPLYPKTEIKEVDLAILKDVDYVIRNKSVFTSPFFTDVFGDTLKDKAFLMRAARDTMFSGFLALPKDQIPQWAIDWVEEEISSRRYDYGVFNKIYQELIKEPQYEYLKDLSQKQKLLKVMIEGMIKAVGDPFTHYFPPDQWILSEQGRQTEGRYRGLGIGLRKNDRGEIAINYVSPGSPAEKAGLKPGDAILAVDEKSTLECTIAQFIVHVKTRKNPTMNLIIRRKLTDQLERVKVTMDYIKVRALFTGPGVDLPNERGISSENLPFYYPLRDRDEKEHPEILYIKIKEFSYQMSQDLKYVLENLDIEKFKGIIIDVRGNPGGRVDAIVYSVDYFLPGDGLITAVKYTDGTVNEIRFNRWNLVPEDIPIAILVDKDSASGAELFPAALRDNGRAVIISKDESTAGKGSVNDYFTLKKGEYGALYISIGLWYTPMGQMIEKMDLDQDGYYEIGGLKPDILVNWTNEDIRENQRNPAWYDPTIFRAIEWVDEETGSSSK
jgi:carboxyl-terminal processing protease